MTPRALEAISTDELHHVTGGGLFSQLGRLIGGKKKGEKGEQIGGLFDQVFGMFKGGFGKTSAAPSTAGAGTTDPAAQAASTSAASG